MPSVLTTTVLLVFAMRQFREANRRDGSESGWELCAAAIDGLGHERTHALQQKRRRGRFRQFVKLM